ncbi:hypothetical protein Y695_00817 [Hydrogenophaga sp. T4]|nr:hypothetical protein Y695_00817 [Hydrogenophaga sp. T4]
MPFIDRSRIGQNQPRSHVDLMNCRQGRLIALARKNRFLHSHKNRPTWWEDRDIPQQKKRRIKRLFSSRRARVKHQLTAFVRGVFGHQRTSRADHRASGRGVVRQGLAAPVNGPCDVCGIRTAQAHSSTTAPDPRRQDQCLGIDRAGHSVVSDRDFTRVCATAAALAAAVICTLVTYLLVAPKPPA